MEGVDLVALVHEFKTLGAWVLVGLGVFALLAIMAWKDSYPWKRRKRRRGEDDSVVP